MRHVRKRRGGHLGMTPEQHLDEISLHADDVYEHVKHSRDALGAKRCDVAIVQLARAAVAYGQVHAHSLASAQPERYHNEMHTAATAVVSLQRALEGKCRWTRTKD
jgi:hypothetical protein